MQYHAPVSLAKTPLPPKERPIVIYIFSFAGIVLYHALKKYGFRIVAICDEHSMHPAYDDTPFVRTADLHARYPDANILICAKYYESIKKRLLGMNYAESNIFDSLCFLGEIDIDMSEILPQAWEIRSTTALNSPELIHMLDLYVYERAKVNAEERVHIRSLDIVVTEKCSLRCKECSNLMQYYQSPRHVDFAALERSLTVLMPCVDSLGEATVLGGEPLLYPHLPELFELLSRYKQIDRIRLFTNGTIIPSKSLLEAMRRHNVYALISDYGRHKAQTVFHVMREASVAASLSKVALWYACSRFAFGEQATPEELREKFSQCCSHDLLTLLHGKLYICPFAAHAENLAAIPGSPDNALELDPFLRKSDLYRFYALRASLDACRYCDGRVFNSRVVPVAEQAEHPLPYRKFPGGAESEHCHACC